MKKLETITFLRMLLSNEELLSVREVAPNRVLGAVTKLAPDSLEALAGPPENLPATLMVEGIGTFWVGGCPAAFEGSPEAAYSRQRMKNKVVIITGGAQGFGAGIAGSFFEEGANVVIADVNVKVGEKLVQAFNQQVKPNRVLFVQTDVADLRSVESLVEKTVLHFGGIDVMVSNAGILRAGGLEEMTAETFSLITRINYEGYFNCAKAAAVVMKMQAARSTDRFFDILQINSKSGLKGSNKNFAYAGGKFGGIGLTQSFAMELMPYRIKVNSVCPGNFFDGPLWSDPETGLFVQYLNAGKVPGAKTIAEVRQFYEQQVPAGRGCTSLDVARAIFYAIEQEYETGQAIPVTGGQNMLH
ncbi:MAG: SDR family NAD(P)-dependent oxidoreductase [Bacteroidales bacterium]|nr:SDR family NAD(P)-dependent oxidoreductase [Bacteroidales bacterium]